jgi:hypothetical protein
MDEAAEIARVRQLLNYFCKEDRDAIRLCEDLIWDTEKIQRIIQKEIKLFYESENNISFVTDAQLYRLERELNRVFKKIGIDIVFTKHFMERVRDERNGKEITLDELRICPKCGWDNCFVDVHFRIKCKDCGYDSLFDILND